MARKLTNGFVIGLLGRCPRCGKGHLFVGFLKLAPECEVCGLDFSFADPADGPAFFAMTIVGVPAVGFALWLQFQHEPPLWVHLVTTLPLIAGLSLLLLRPLKGWLVLLQYRHKAQEGTIDKDWRDRRS
jgi:uncharacterized protein (DUF983 family)